MEIHVRSVQLRLYVYFIVICIYFSFGTYLFYNLEHDASLERRELYSNRCVNIKNQAIKELEEEIKILEKTNKLKELTENIYSINSPLHKNILKLLEKIDECHREHNITNVKEITIPNAFSFVYSISATLGYGDIEAQTLGGKIFFILFSLISIPLFISFYVDLTEWFVGEIVEIYYKAKLYFKKLTSKKSNEIYLRKKIEHQKKKQLPKVVVSMLCLITIFFITSYNHLKQQEDDDTFLQSMSFVFESIALIGLGNNVPEDTVKYLTKELPLIFIGVCFFGLYLNSTVNIFRHMIPTILSKYRKKDKNSFDILDYIIYQPKQRNLGVLSDYRSDSYMKHSTVSTIQLPL
uniref:Ion_trans_2 domain-containing protein n=1 Tax=Parastrongyloides trichosuri TaxID=131310 RepID=A0A0N4ZJ24_PARTI